MKKLLLSLCLLVATLAAAAADFQSGNLYFNILTEPADGNPGTVEVAPPPSGAYQLSSATGYTFPDVVTYNGNTYNVTAIGVRAFKDAKFTSSNSNKVYPMMWLGNNVQEIKAEAFMGCQLNLTGFRAAITTIDPSAYKDNKINWFNSSNSIYTSDGKGVILSQGGTHLSFFGGVHCSDTPSTSGFVTNYAVASSIVAIDDYAMSGNSKIVTLNLGSVQSIGKESCARMTALKTLTIPATATTIDADAFLGTTGITTLNVNLTEPVPGVVFDDAVYERLRDHVNFAANANIGAFQADPDWGKFFSNIYPKLYIAGSFTDWANGKLEMSCDNDGNYSITVADVPNGATFKFLNEDNTWFGGATNDETYRVHSGWCTDIDLSDTGKNFVVDGTGTLTFNVSADMKLTITGWATGVYLAGTMTDWTTNKVEMAINNGILTITSEMAANDEFKFIDYANNWYGATGSYVIDSDHLGIDLDVTTVNGGENFKVEQAGVYVLAFDKTNMKLNVTLAPFDATPFQAGKLYYKPVSETEVEIIPDPSGVPYTIELDNPNELTTQVTNSANSKVYTVIGIGEGAFEDGSIRTKASYNTTANSTGYFFFPNTITYVSANAFKNVTSQLFGLRLGNITSIDNTAFLNNHIVWFNTGMSGSVYKVSSESGNNGDNVGGLLYKEEEGVKTLLCFPGDRHRDYRKLKADGTNWVDNPNYTIATVADLSAYNVIGENAMYGNTNIKTLILGANLTAIETNAFKNATAITSITCNATVPPTGAVFEDAVIAACKDKLVIPAGTEAAYRADENWTKFFSPAYNVTIAEGITNGTVTADKETAIEGTTVTLTATPDEGYQLETLTVMNGETAVETTATETGATFLMPAADVTVSATFSLIPPPTFAITIDENIENGTVTADKEEAEEGDTVTLTVTPAEGYQLETITVNPETLELVVEVNENNQFIMPADNVTVTATFSLIPPTMYTITIDENIENGTVTADKAEAEEGEIVTLTVTPAEGYQLENITVSPETLELEVIVDENYQFTMPADNVTVTATFSLIPPTTYTITIDENIENGTVTADKAEAEEGEIVTLTVTPAEGYQLKTITVTGVNTDVLAPVDENNQFEMPADDVFVTAEFEEIPPVVVESAVTFNAEIEHATIEVSVDGEPIVSGALVAEGTEVTVTVTPENGYYVQNISIVTVDTAEPDGPAGMPRRADVNVTPGDNNTYTFNMPAEPINIDVTMAQQITTGIYDLNVNGNKGVKYINAMGQVSDRPFEGINIVIDGDKVYKVVK
ncbi:MAG: leucine-rich repeat protein [Muribaculaceae bacterium]|nr:leucine-rich repeat protein [Muribaculaceae bacterium]